MLSLWVVNQQSREEAEDVFPIHLVGLQDLLQVTQQLLYIEDHCQLSSKHANDTDVFMLFISIQIINNASSEYWGEFTVSNGGMNRLISLQRYRNTNKQSQMHRHAVKPWGRVSVSGYTHMFLHVKICCSLSGWTDYTSHLPFWKLRSAVGFLLQRSTCSAEWWRLTLRTGDSVITLQFTNYLCYTVWVH